MRDSGSFSFASFCLLHEQNMLERAFPPSYLTTTLLQAQAGKPTSVSI
jgi:hypothetical protein